jgi:membrane protein DedA with SNARE-associated domain
VTTLLISLAAFIVGMLIGYWRGYRARHIEEIEENIRRIEELN